MPMIDTEPDALSRVYARSLFELAESEGGQARIEEIGAELGELVDLARADKAFGEFLSSRIIAGRKRAASLDRILQGRVSDVVRRFALALNAKERLAHLPSIAGAYDQLVQERFGRVEVDVYTATPVDRAVLDRVGASLKKTIGKDPVLHPYTDAGMIGGLKLQIGDQLIDASISTRLRRMRERFTGPGAEAVRAKAGRIIEGR